MNNHIKFILASLCLLVLIGCNNLSSRNPKVFLLGTVHSVTPNVNADSIYNVLVKFKPDIILMELDSSFFNEDFTYKTLFDGNEIIATVRYKMNNPKVQIRPIEFEGRETFREKIGIYPEITNEFGKVLEALFVTHKLNKYDKENVVKLFYYDSLNA